ncbi:MAG: phosphatase PAP2 family protein, partial [Bacteroidota bacterium]
VAGAGYLVASHLARKWAKGIARVAITTTAVLFLYSHIFQAIAGFQHILVPGWMDAQLIAWESALTGTESSVAIQKITTPLLTEWMMFSYVLYVPLLPLVAVLCYVRGGEQGNLEYLVNIAFANILCNVGFVLFPVAGPLFHDATRYSVSLDGGLFSSCGEWMRSNVHYPGGSLPSPHCAAGTVMIVMLYRYHRKAFRLLLPPLATIYVATVYGRYHYAWDVIAGIGAAVITLKASPILTRVLERYQMTMRGVLTIGRTPNPATGRLQEERS